jgi:RNA 2',3'-cyclic 3'-phosphodiesterase
MRLFVAIDLSAEIRERLIEYITTLVREVPESAAEKWVRPESLHLTLKFIGQSERLGDIKLALREVQSASFHISVAGVGFFTPQKPRIFWAGVQAPAELQRLASAVDAAVAKSGVPSEKEAYHPHITLARTGSGRPHGAKASSHASLAAIKNAIDANSALANAHFGTMMPREFFLFRSETLPEGARYTKLEGFPLR